MTDCPHFVWAENVFWQLSLTDYSKWIRIGQRAKSKREEGEKKRTGENWWNRVKTFYLVWNWVNDLSVWYANWPRNDFQTRKCKQNIDRLAINQALPHRWINFALHIHLGDGHKISKIKFDLYQRLKISWKQLTRDLRFTLIDMILIWAKIVIKPKKIRLICEKNSIGIHMKILFEGNNVRIWNIGIIHWKWEYRKFKCRWISFQIACFAYFD